MSIKYFTSRTSKRNSLLHQSVLNCENIVMCAEKKIRNKQNKDFLIIIYLHNTYKTLYLRKLIVNFELISFYDVHKKLWIERNTGVHVTAYYEQHTMKRANIVHTYYISDSKKGFIYGIGNSFSCLPSLKTG